MKKYLVILSPIVFVFFIACGGKDDGAPPPIPPALGLAMNNPNDQQALRDLQMAANQAKRECSQSMSPLMLVMATRIQSGSPGLPFLPQGAGGDCSNSLTNFLMQYSTLAQGQYANDPSTRPWFISQVGGIINRIGGFLVSQGVQLTPDLQQKLFMVGIQYARQQIVPGLSPSIRGPACAGFSQYGGGC